MFIPTTHFPKLTTPVLTILVPSKIRVVLAEEQRKTMFKWVNKTGKIKDKILKHAHTEE